MGDYYAQLDDKRDELSLGIAVDDTAGVQRTAVFGTTAMAEIGTSKTDSVSVLEKIEETNSC